MSFQIVDNTADSINSGTSLTARYPQNQEGDGLVLFVVTGGGTTAETPEGWNSHDNVSNTSQLRLHCFSRISNGALPSTFEIGLQLSPPATFISSAVFTIRGTNRNSLVNQSGAGSTSFGNSFVHNGLTTTKACFLLCAWAVGADVGLSKPSDMDLAQSRVNEWSASGDSLLICTLPQASDGPTGAKTATSSVSAHGCSFMIALAPAEPPGAPGSVAVQTTPADRNNTVTWTAATDPDTSSSLLRYEGEVFNGTSWSTLFALTTQGATSAAVDFTNVTATTSAKVRVRAVDPDNNTGPWAESSTFTIQHAPSAPTVTFPNGGNVIIIGQTVTLTATAATDPNTPQNQLTYRWEYSDNGGGSWNLIGSETSAGVTSINWNTTGRTAGTNYLVRCRARDETSLEGPFDQSNSVFELRADIAPTAPTQLAPDGGSSTIIDRALALIFSFKHNDPGDLPSEARILWGTDGSTFPNSVVVSDPFTDEFISHSIAGGTFAAGTVFWKCWTQDQAENQSPDSAVASFLAANKPAAPTINSPAHLGTVTDPRITATWSSTSQQRYELELLDSAETVVLWTSGIVTSAVGSRAIDFDLTNGVTYKVRFRYSDSAAAQGLWSDYDINQFTVSFTEPNAPTVAINSTSKEYNLITITNPAGGGTVTENEIWRYLTSAGSSTAIRIKKGIAANGTYKDRHTAHGKQYSYYAVAKTATGLFRAGAAVAATLELARAWMHDTRDPEATSYQFINTAVGEAFQHDAKEFKLEGRADVVISYGAITERSLLIEIVARRGTAEYENLLTLYMRKSTFCYRDAVGNIAFCGWIPMSNIVEAGGRLVTFTLKQVEYNEADHA